MLTTAILPMPSLDPQRYVATYLTNPLLLAAHPDRMRATAEQWAAGGYNTAATAALAIKLWELRKHELRHTPVQPRDNEAERELLDLAEHPLLKHERTHLREKIMEARPSEYAWLRPLLESAILTADAQRDNERLETAPPSPHARRQLLRDVALIASRATGVTVVLASELAA